MAWRNTAFCVRIESAMAGAIRAVRGMVVLGATPGELGREIPPPGAATLGAAAAGDCRLSSVLSRRPLKCWVLAAVSVLFAGTPVACSRPSGKRNRKCLCLGSGLLRAFDKAM